MIIKMTITFDYNPETNEYKPIKQEIVKETPKPAKLEDDGEPRMKLLDNKYELNNSAINLLGLGVGDRVDIKYQVVDGLKYPIIGSSDNWKCATGNKLTKSGTVSCRGTANQMLAEYGDEFTFSEWKDHKGLYVLIGNKEIEQDENIEIPDDEPVDDIKDEDFSADDFELSDLNFDNIE